MALSPIQHLAVKYLSAGWPVTRTAAELRLPPWTVTKWKQDPEFQEALTKGVLQHSELVEAMLLEGESRAAETLIQALAAAKNGVPQWTVRVQAAITLLDRAGQRGKAIERQAVAQVNPGGSLMGGDQLEEGLRKALRDPGVRAWLKSTGGVEALAQAADAEPILEVLPPQGMISSVSSAAVSSAPLDEEKTA